MFSQRQTIKKF